MELLYESAHNVAFDLLSRIHDMQLDNWVLKDMLLAKKKEPAKKKCLELVAKRIEKYRATPEMLEEYQKQYEALRQRIENQAALDMQAMLILLAGLKSGKKNGQ
jgi:ABC-type Fe3+-hydroxamate transport system substrate-binding protein